MKKPWLAVFLSSLLPGTGQLYAGKRNRGIWVSVAWLFFCLVAVACFVEFLLSESDQLARQLIFLAAVAGASSLFLQLHSLFDSYKAAKNFNAAFGAPAASSSKKEWLAVFLSHILPGLGQLYNRQIIKGILFIVAAVGVAFLTNFTYSLGLLSIPISFFAIKDSFESAAKINGAAETFLKGENRLIGTFIIVMIIFSGLPLGGIIKTNALQAFKFPSGSMLPTLQVGDHILVNKTNRAKASIRRGDIVVFRYPKDPRRDFLKRIVAIGGDTIEEKNKIIYVNGRALSEPYAVHTDDVIKSDTDPRDNFGPYVVPIDDYFVLGDNRDQSYDSRYWGAVPREYIIGRATKIYWSWDADKSGVRWNRIGKLLD